MFGWYRKMRTATVIKSVSHFFCKILMDLWIKQFTIRLRISDLRVQLLLAGKRECNVKTTNDIEADFVPTIAEERKGFSRKSHGDVARSTWIFSDRLTWDLKRLWISVSGEMYLSSFVSLVDGKATFFSGKRSMLVLSPVILDYYTLAVAQRRLSSTE